VPLTAFLPPRLLTKQFTQTFTWGGQYLQPSSRVLGLLTLLTSFLTARLPDPVEAGKWSIWVGLFCLLVTIAPYEIYLIFPINDRVTEIGEALDKGKEREEEQKRELQSLLGKWAFRNWGRISMPVVVGVVGIVWGTGRWD
jgi:hypothetical protein